MTNEIKLRKRFSDAGLLLAKLVFFVPLSSIPYFFFYLVISCGVLSDKIEEYTKDKKRQYVKPLLTTLIVLFSPVIMVSFIVIAALATIARLALDAFFLVNHFFNQKTLKISQNIRETINSIRANRETLFNGTKVLHLFLTSTPAVEDSYLNNCKVSNDQFLKEIILLSKEHDYNNIYQRLSKYITNVVQTADSIITEFDLYFQCNKKDRNSFFKEKGKRLNDLISSYIDQLAPLLRLLCSKLKDVFNYNEADEPEIKSYRELALLASLHVLTLTNIIPKIVRSLEDLAKMVPDTFTNIGIHSITYTHPIDCKEDKIFLRDDCGEILDYSLQNYSQGNPKWTPKDLKSAQQEIEKYHNATAKFTRTRCAPSTILENFKVSSIWENRGWLDFREV